MKKCLAVLILVVMLISSAIAETADLSAMNDEELIALYQDVKAELERRGLKVDDVLTLREGKYIVDEDVMAGEYIVTCLSTDTDKLGDAYSSLGGFAEDDSLNALFGSLGSLMKELGGMEVKILGDYGDVLKSFELEAGDTMNLTLSAGTALEIVGGSCTLQKK